MVFRSHEEWQKVLSDYRGSNESIRLFCRRHKISSSSLYYRLSKSEEHRLPQVNMLPVIASEPKSSVDGLELLLANGMILRFSSGASVCYVADIIKALSLVN